MDYRLRQALSPLAAMYDFIFLDCPPRNRCSPPTLVAADRIVARGATFLALEGVQNLLGQTARVREATGSRVQALGLVLSMVDYRLKLTREIVDSLREEYGALVFGIEIRTNVRLAEAPAFGKTIFQHDAKATGAGLFELLAEEFLLRAGYSADRIVAPAPERAAGAEAPVPEVPAEPLAASEPAADSSTVN